MNAAELLTGSCAEFDRRVQGIDDDQWARPTPCSDWESWFENMEEAYRGAGAIGSRATVQESADEQAELLAMFGRSA